MNDIRHGATSAELLAVRRRRGVNLFLRVWSSRNVANVVCARTAPHPDNTERPVSNGFSHKVYWRNRYIFKYWTVQGFVCAQ